MKIGLLIGATMLAAAATSAPAFAQMNNGSMQSNSTQPAPMPSGTMQSDPAMKMSASDMKKMQVCQAMSQEAMMKDKRCMKMMKMHPDMMKNSPNGG